MKHHGKPIEFGAKLVSKGMVRRNFETKQKMPFPNSTPPYHCRRVSASPLNFGMQMVSFARGNIMTV